MRYRLSLGVMAYCFVFGTVASAGPIEFSYSVNTATTPGTPSPGTLTLDLLPGGPVTFGEFGGSFTFGYITFGDSPHVLGSGPGLASSLFDVSLDVTDSLGNVGTLAVSGSAVDEWGWLGDQLTQLRHGLTVDGADGDGMFLTKSVIGGNEYYVRVNLQPDGAKAVFTLGVGPVDNGPETPEPGTLALAAIGLAPVGLRVLRRRKTQPAI